MSLRHAIFLGLLFQLQATSATAVEDKPGFSLKFLFSFGDDSILDLNLAQPRALAVGPEGKVFVLDTGNNRILKFDARGNFEAAVGGFGWEREQFDRPLDFSVKSGLDIFIADYNNERIERYDRELNYISSFAAESILDEELRFGFPGSVDISKHGELFICDNENDSILKLNSLGDAELRFGDFNWGGGQLEFPVKIEISDAELVYVTDQGANQIVVFDTYGNFVSRFGSGILRNPGGLTWSSDGKLLVADSGNNRIAVFTGDQSLIFSWGNEGDKIGAFRDPVDVAVFDNRIYVLDSANSRVQVFALLNKIK